MAAGVRSLGVRPPFADELVRSAKAMGDGGTVARTASRASLSAAWIWRRWPSLETPRALSRASMSGDGHGASAVSRKSLSMCEAGSRARSAAPGAPVERMWRSIVLGSVVLRGRTGLLEWLTVVVA